MPADPNHPPLADPGESADEFVAMAEAHPVLLGIGGLLAVIALLAAGWFLLAPVTDSRTVGEELCRGLDLDPVGATLLGGGASSIAGFSIAPASPPAADAVAAAGLDYLGGCEIAADTATQRRGTLRVAVGGGDLDIPRVAGQLGARTEGAAEHTVVFWQLDATGNELPLAAAVRSGGRWALLALDPAPGGDGPRAVDVRSLAGDLQALLTGSGSGVAD